MIIDLPTTNSSKINKALVDVREKGGSIALGRVLTLVIVTEDSASEDPIAAANAASFEHPCRVIVVARGSQAGLARDWTRRSGSAATPVPARWSCSGCTGRWSTTAPPWSCRCCWPTHRSSSGGPARRRRSRPRIRSGCSANDGSPTPHPPKRPTAQLAKRRDSYRPGDTDLSWTRITRWRGLLASTLDQPPHDKVTAATVAGAADSPSADLLAGWLALALKCPVKRIKSPAKSGPGLHSVDPDPPVRRHQPDPAADHHRRTQGRQPARAARRAPPPWPAGLPVRGTAPPGRR